MSNEIQETSELILIIGEINVPDKIKSINADIKNILPKKKFSKILSTGAIGSLETLEWLTSLCKDNSSRNLFIVKSQDDEDTGTNYPETKVLKIGNFNIGLINGFQVTPWDDLEGLSTIQKALNADILISGFTNKMQVRYYNGAYFINPGSLTGCFSPLNNDSSPVFLTMIVDSDIAILYSYAYNISSKNFEIGKLEINKVKADEG